MIWILITFTICLSSLIFTYNMIYYYDCESSKLQAEITDDMLMDKKDFEKLNICKKCNKITYLRNIFYLTQTILIIITYFLLIFGCIGIHIN